MAQAAGAARRAGDRHRPLSGPQWFIPTRRGRPHHDFCQQHRPLRLRSVAFGLDLEEGRKQVEGTLLLDVTSTQGLRTGTVFNIYNPNAANSTAAEVLTITPPAAGYTVSVVAYGSPTVLP